MNESSQVVGSGPWAVGSGQKRETLPILNLPRFAFPWLPEEAESAPTDSGHVVWPECGNRYAALAADKIAVAMLRQVWGENAGVFMSDRHQVLGITSPGDGDGKTDMLVALAPSLIARMDREILVVDANFDKPDLTNRLRMSSDAMARRTPMIYPTNHPSLNVLPAPTDVTSESFQQSMLEEIREEWPLVILDMPALARPETLTLACACDGVYLTVRLGHTSRRAAAQAGRLIRHAGGQLLGCIVIR